MYLIQLSLLLLVLFHSFDTFSCLDRRSLQLQSERIVCSSAVWSAQLIQSRVLCRPPPFFPRVPLFSHACCAKETSWLVPFSLVSTDKSPPVSNAKDKGPLISKLFLLSVIRSFARGFLAIYISKNVNSCRRNLISSWLKKSGSCST